MLCGFLIGTIYKYPNNTVEVTFPDDNYVIKTYNAIGDVIKIKEKDNSAIEYKYHCSGQLKQVLMDNNNAKVTIEYDALGRRTALIDPNAGTTSYNLYNAFGDVIQQTDDRSIVTVNTYDNLRRLKTQSMTNEPTKTYNYYPSGNGKGQLQSITSSKSELNYDYGDFGRLTKMTEKIVGDQSFVTQYEYDQYGNKTGITYPGGFKVKRNYDTIGYVTDIRQASNNQLIWQRLTENALGQPLTYKMGNGKTTTCLYDGYNLPKRVSAPGIQDFEYNINPENGNMNWRRDNLKSFPNQEIFDYDITSRLKGVDHGNQNVMSMQYYPNGNIRSKQDAGSGYQYQIYPKFHALSSITEPTNVLINSGHQEVEYNGFNKATTIYNNQSQRLVIDYGVDNQRMRTRFYKGHIFLDKTKYFAANYEKEVTSSTTREINYISTPYGVLAAYIKENNNTGQMYYLYKDHLGSITHITNASGEVKETRSFDAWGRMRNPKNWSYTGVDPMSILDRGYTGHEHLFGFDLINMNGRMYDPIIGRFLSPDPYVQGVGTQGFNRYSYARNNPLKFTDPTGYKVKWWQWGLLVMGLSDPATASATIVTTGVGIVGITIGVGVSSYFTTALNVPIMAIAGGIFTNYDGKNAIRNSWRINNGLFVTDPNKNFFGRTGEFTSRFTWEALQTVVGYSYTQGRNFGGNVDRVDYLGGATFATRENTDKREGVSLGNYININISDEITGSFKDRVTTDPLFMHEFGHYLQSHRWGLAYLFGVGIPSLISAKNSTQVDGEPIGVSTHDFYWTEMKANNRAARYFRKYYGVDWDEYETFYPRIRR